jgi:hypothetical protein
LQDCDKIAFKTVLNTRFSSDELTKLIIQYNECHHQQQYTTKALKTKIILGVLSGMAMTKIQTNTSTIRRFIGQSFNFDIQPIIGLSLTFVLPSEKQRLMIYNEFSYRQFGGSSSVNIYDNSTFYTINAIEMSFKQLRSLHSLRYSLNDKRKLLRPFVDAGVGTYLSLGYTDSWKRTNILGSSTPLEGTTIPLLNKGEVVSPQFFAWAGTGFFYKSFSVALRYEYVPYILNLTNIASTTQSFSLAIGYQLKPF